MYIKLLRLVYVIVYYIWIIKASNLRELQIDNVPELLDFKSEYFLCKKCPSGSVCSNFSDQYGFLSDGSCVESCSDDLCQPRWDIKRKNFVWPSCQSCSPKTCTKSFNIHNANYLSQSCNNDVDCCGEVNAKCTSLSWLKGNESTLKFCCRNLNVFCEQPTQCCSGVCDYANPNETYKRCLNELPEHYSLMISNNDTTIEPVIDLNPTTENSQNAIIKSHNTNIIDDNLELQKEIWPINNSTQVKMQWVFDPVANKLDIHVAQPNLSDTLIEIQPLDNTSKKSNSTSEDVLPSNITITTKELNSRAKSIQTVIDPNDLDKSIYFDKSIDNKSNKLDDTSKFETFTDADTSKKLSDILPEIEEFSQLIKNISDFIN